MASYTDCGTNVLAVGTALTAYYGAYHADDNPTGVTIHSSAGTTLIFSCTAISDKVIKLTHDSNDLRAYYGTAYSGGDITGAVEWGGSNTTGGSTKLHLVLTDKTLVLNAIVSTINSRLYLIGKLNNGAYAVAGMIGHSSTTYNSGAFAYLTATQSQIFLFGLALNVKSESGLVYKTPLVVYTTAGGVPYTGDDPVQFQDVSSCSRSLGAAVCYKGDGYFITTSNMYFNNAASAIECGLLVEDIE